MSDEAAFLKAIADNPDDRTARLVYADWLQERDDVRAAWVRDDDVWEWMKPDAHDPRDELTQAARKGLRNADDVLPKLGGHAIPAIFAVYKTAGSTQAFRLKNVLTSIGARAEAVLPFLLAAADDRSPDIQYLALHCLEHLVPTHAQARERVFQALDSKQKNVWYSAAWSLVDVGAAGAPVVPRLIELLADKEAVWPVARVFKSIGSPGARPAIPTLMALFTATGKKSEHWYEVRLALAAMGADAVGPLLAVVPPDTASNAFTDLVGTLTDIGPTAIPELEKRADDANPAVRQAVKEALARLAPKMGAELLRSSDPDEVARTLKHLRDHEREAVPAIPGLIEILANRALPTAFRETAARVLGRLGERAKAAVPTLIDIFPDADFDLAQLACWALDEMGHQPTATLLWLRRKPPNRRQAGIEASRVRRGIYGGDREFASRQEVYAIASRVRRPAPLVAAAEAAFAPNAVAALTTALSDTSADVRLIAALGLWHIGTPEAAAALLPALADTNAAVRAQAAEVIGLIGRRTPGALDALKTAAKAEGQWQVKDALDAAVKRFEAK